MFLSSLMMAFFLLFSQVHLEAKHSNKPIEFVIVIPSYNNEKWCIQNLESVAEQAYPYFTAYYINDCSTDKTGALVEEFVRSRNLQHKFKVVNNQERKGSLANLYEVIHSISPDKVIVDLDGDDRLSHPGVLSFLASVYEKNRDSQNAVWLTYGSFASDPSGFPSYCNFFPQEVINNLSFRSYAWISSHLRTFYAGLFQRIKKEDFMWKGQFLPVAGDLAFMFPMLEMAARNHFTFISKTLYIYNANNPISDYKAHTDLVIELSEFIRAKERYNPLINLFK